MCELFGRISLNGPLKSCLKQVRFAEENETFIIPMEAPQRSSSDVSLVPAGTASAAAANNSKRSQRSKSTVPAKSVPVNGASKVQKRRTKTTIPNSERRFSKRLAEKKAFN